MLLLHILVLYVSFRAKQVICDFFMQTGWQAMVREAALTREGMKALAVHAGVHAAFTFMLVVIFAPKLWWLGFVDFFLHAAIDRTKASVTLKNGWTYKNYQYWWAFGLDQEAHNLTHLLYIVLIVVFGWGVPLNITP
ncbi:MAG TPA: DUF3307 domain-containing protein [Alphaproteobacteria bacterium]|nr:DUF3307 domain-containing protein [Alphaproteobacteria bacterium]